MSSETSQTPDLTNRFVEAILEELPDFRKRRREAVESLDAEWGGSLVQIAPTRRQRGHLVRTNYSRPQEDHAKESEVAQSSRKDKGHKGKESSRSWVNSRQNRKRARLDIFNAPRLELPIQQMPSQEPSNSSASGESDQPQRVSPPVRTSWREKLQPLSKLRSRPAKSNSPPESNELDTITQDNSAIATSTDHHGVGSSHHGLPLNHPLKVHLTALQKERKKRKFEWAGLIDVLGDEFRNPASYDRRLWLREEQKADEAIVNTMLQIKMAEKGLSLQTDDASESALRFPEQQVARDTNADRGTRYPRRSSYGGISLQTRGNHARRGGHGGRMARSRQRHHSSRRRTSTAVPLHQQTIHGRLHENFQGGPRKANAPTKTPMTWDEGRKDDAVRTWLRSMGMPEETTATGPPRSPVGSVDVANRTRRSLLTMDRLPPFDFPEGDNDGGDEDEDEDEARSFISLGGGNGDIDACQRRYAVSSGVKSRRGVTSPWDSESQEGEENENFEAAERAREMERAEAAWQLEKAKARAEVEDEPSSGIVTRRGNADDMDKGEPVERAREVERREVSLNLPQGGAAVAAASQVGDETTTGDLPLRLMAELQMIDSGEMDAWGQMAAEKITTRTSERPIGIKVEPGSDDDDDHHHHQHLSITQPSVAKAEEKEDDGGDFMQLDDSSSSAFSHTIAVRGVPVLDMSRIPEFNPDQQT